MYSNLIFYVYFFRRDNIFGFDEISIIALNQLQAEQHLTKITHQGNEFFYSHKILLTRINMGKQLTLLRKIIDAYKKIDLNSVLNKTIKKNNSIFIKQMFNRSLNKKDLIRRILFDALLSDDDILKLLRIIFDKEK